MLVLDSDVSRIFREIKYMLSKREIKQLSNDEKCDLIETSYIAIYKQLSIYLHEFFYSPIFISESESKEISQYEEIHDKLFMWLENVYGRFVDFFEKEYTHDDHVRVFYDVEKLLESLQDEIKDFRQTVNGNDHSKRFSGDPKNNLNILLGNNTNFPEDDTKWISTETNQQPDDCSRKSKSNVIHLPLQQSTVEENDSSDNKQIILNEDFKEIGTCIKAITIRRIAINEGLVFSESLFFEVNLFREVWFFNLMLDSNSLRVLVV